MTATDTRPPPPHGTLTRHKKHGCRCDECNQASRDYDTHRNRQIAYGRWIPPVDAQPVRDHIAMLAEHGIGWMRVAELAGLSSGILSRWLYGSTKCPVPKKVDAANAAKVLAIRPTLDCAADHALIDATGTRRRIQALIWAGFPQSVLAGRIGWDRSNFTKLLRARLVHASTARAMRALFDGLAGVDPESCGVSWASAKRARNHARRNGWAPAAAWDDIDDPNAVPNFGASVNPTEALVENAEWLHDEHGLSWEAAAAQLGVPKDTLHTYRSRVRERAAANAGGAI